MSSRGRGRGSFGGRGGGYRGTYRGSNRGSYESRGGRGGGYSGGYDSRYNSGGNRYSGRDRIEESYKKPYRSESSSNYSARDYGGRSGSPERKRMRVEGSSDRRSHDGGGHYYRQDSYSSERRGFVDERRRSPGRDGYRKSEMPPPRSPARSAAPRSRVSRPPRRSFRGRALRSRGSFRARASFAPRRYAERPLGYTRAFRSIKGHSKTKEEEASSTEEDWDADEKDDDGSDEKKEIKIKTPKENPKTKKEVEDSEQAAVAAEEDGEETDKEGAAASEDEEVAPARVSSQPYVHLTCVHCKEKYATFAGYSKHLVSGKHRTAMTNVARRHKTQLLRMRVAQRSAQRELEAAAGAELAARTTFCLICRLNHRTTKHAHNLTDTHRAMKRFLLPFCRVCRVTFRSPMIYEHHICSLEHLKRKAVQTTRHASPKEAEASGDEGMDVDLDNFMTIDSVGDVDEVDDEDSGTEKKDDAAPKKPKVEINIGSEHIKKLEVYWCELCRTYLPRGAGGAGGAGAGADPEALRRHCRLRLHLGRYVQHRDTRTLRKHAERIHRQLHQGKGDAEKNNTSTEEITAKKENSEVSENGQDKKLENGTDASNASGNEDKLWADVDKDIGDLLREVDPQVNVASDDDDDLDRYDKFRKSDKIANDTEEAAAITNETVVEKKESTLAATE